LQQQKFFGNQLHVNVAKVRAYTNVNKRRRSLHFRLMEEGNSGLSQPMRLHDIASGHMVEGRFRKAMKILKRGARAHPEDITISGMLLDGYMQRGDIGKAAQVFNRMAKKGIAGEPHYFGMIDGSLKAKRPEIARTVYEMALEKGVESDRILFAAQEARIASGQAASA